MTYDRSEILRAAHAKVRAARAMMRRPARYADLLRLHLRMAWTRAKGAAVLAARAAFAAANPAASRASELRDQLAYEEAAERGYNFARVSALRAELAALAVAA